MAKKLPILPQAAAICYRTRPSLQVMLLLRDGRRKWGVPKGIVDPGNDGRETCRIEAWEEAGVEGKVSKRPIARFHYEKWGYRCEVDVYLLRVKTEHESWDEDHMRRREWFDPEEAVETCGWPALSTLIEDLPHWIEVAGP